MAERTRVEELIEILGLTRHPEGGYFREVYRSESSVYPLDGRPDRASLTTIDFLLPAGEVARWHRVASDETWHHYEGDPADLFIADSEFKQLGRHVLGPVGHGSQPVHVVPAYTWQSARSTGAYTLVGCTVAPGFEFEDFEVSAAFDPITIIRNAIGSWPGKESLAEYAEARHGYMNTDGGYGIHYAEDLDSHDRDVDGIVIPPGHIQVIGGWRADEMNVPESLYLKVLAEELAAAGRVQDAARVRALIGALS